MKIQYMCEECGKSFPTEEAARVCEAKHIEARNKAKKDKEELDRMISQYMEASATLDKLGQDIAKRSKLPLSWMLISHMSRR